MAMYSRSESKYNKNRVLLLFLLLVVNTAIAQKKNDFAADAVSKFPDAMAIWTERRQEVNIGWDNGQINVTQKEYEEFLFTKDESVNYVGKRSVYYSHFYQLKDWQAYTLLPDGKKAKVTNHNTHSAGRSYVFFDDSKEIEFFFPGVVKGARGVIESNYELSDPSLLGAFYFDNYFPVLSGQLVISFPSEVEMGYMLKGLGKDSVKVKSETRKGKTTLTFEVSDMKSVGYYEDAPSSAYYMTHVLFYIKKVKDANGVMQPYLGGKEDLGRHCSSLVRNVETEAGPEVKHVTDSLLKGLVDPEEKAIAIYKFVQQRVRYIAFEEGMGGFIPRNPELVCERRYGDCKDKSTLLLSMLRYAGFKAYFTWIGSRDIPYDFSDVPLPLSSDHMICTLDLNGEFIFMDATDPYIPFRIPASHIQGKEAFIMVGENDFRIKRVPVQPSSYSGLIDTSFISLEGKSVKGTVKLHLVGYYANNLMHTLESRTGKQREDFLQSYCSRGNNKVVFNNISLKIDTASSVAVITADFQLPDYAKFLGNEVYLNLNLVKPFVNEEIDFPKRTIPVKYEFGYVLRHVVVLNVPETYKVTVMPKPSAFLNDVWGARFTYSLSAGKLLFGREFESRHITLPPGMFERWNKVLEFIYPIYKQSVVLEKE